MASHPQHHLDFQSANSVECPEPVEGLSFVYILMFRNSSFYVGISDNVSKRLELHRHGFGARQTMLLKSFKLVYVEGPMDRDSAAKRERQLKKWSRAKKIALLSNDFETLRSLSQSRDS